MRIVTDTGANVVARHDYLPFGEELYPNQAGRDASFGVADGLHQRFTGQERDGETTPNLDYFGARYLSGEQGRFLSPDPANAGADLLHPQSWNGYSYALNSPLVYRRFHKAISVYSYCCLITNRRHFRQTATKLT